MKKYFKITNLNNFTDYIAGIPVKMSVATVTSEDQLRVIDRQKHLGDFNFVEITEDEALEQWGEKKETDNLNKYDVEKRSKDVEKDVKKPASVKKTSKRGTGRRGRPKKQ